MFNKNILINKKKKDVNEFQPLEVFFFCYPNINPN